MAGVPSFGDFAKKVESSLAEVPSQAVGVLSNTAHALAEGIAAVPKTFGLPTQEKFGGGDVDLDNLKRPAAAIVGGTQIQYQAEQIESLLDKTDVLILSGEMIFAFYKAQGLSVGSTPVSDEDVQLAKSILDKAKDKGVKVVLPTHVVVADSDQDYANTKIVAASEIPDGWIGTDMAPASVELIADAVNGAKTVLWNGEVGTYSDSTAEGIRKMVEELGEKGVKTFIRESFSGTENAPYDEKKIENTRNAGDEIGMFHFGG